MCFLMEKLYNLWSCLAKKKKKKSNLNLQHLLDPPTNLQEILRTEEHIKLHHGPPLTGDLEQDSDLLEPQTSHAWPGEKCSLIVWLWGLNNWAYSIMQSSRYIIKLSSQSYSSINFHFKSQFPWSLWLHLFILI